MPGGSSRTLDRREESTPHFNTRYYDGEHALGQPRLREVSRRAGSVVSGVESAGFAVRRVAAQQRGPSSSEQRVQGTIAATTPSGRRRTRLLTRSRDRARRPLRTSFCIPLVLEPAPRSWILASRIVLPCSTSTRHVFVDVRQPRRTRAGSRRGPSSPGGPRPAVRRARRGRRRRPRPGRRRARRPTRSPVRDWTMLSTAVAVLMRRRSRRSSRQPSDDDARSSTKESQCLEPVLFCRSPSP